MVPWQKLQIKRSMAGLHLTGWFYSPEEVTVVMVVNFLQSGAKALGSLTGSTPNAPSFPRQSPSCSLTMRSRCGSGWPAALLQLLFGQVPSPQMWTPRLLAWGWEGQPRLNDAVARETSPRLGLYPCNPPAPGPSVCAMCPDPTGLSFSINTDPARWVLRNLKGIACGFGDSEESSPRLLWSLEEEVYVGAAQTLWPGRRKQARLQEPRRQWAWCSSLSLSPQGGGRFGVLHGPLGWGTDFRHRTVLRHPQYGP